uniref:Uncharacterized protein n=4 Tax=Nothobranchius TaxID=28779 RepID=A0A1A8AUG1_NOTFU
MNVFLFLWIALVPLFCYGSEDYDEYDNDTSVTPMPDYDYNSTFEYYYVTEDHVTDTDQSKPTDIPDVGQVAEPKDRNRSCRPTIEKTLTINVLLMSLILFH